MRFRSCGVRQRLNWWYTGRVCGVDTRRGYGWGRRRELNRLKKGGTVVGNVWAEAVGRTCGRVGRVGRSGTQCAAGEYRAGHLVRGDEVRWSSRVR